ncbi:MAG: CoA transferase, partial [Actinomycetota bacterium]|nr:CoA transferase [Actinomycetota bacterium]
GSFVRVGETVQPAPAPRFSRTAANAPTLAPEPGADTDEALSAWGLDEAEITMLRESGAVV